MSYKVSSRKVQGVSIYNKNKHLNVQFIVRTLGFTRTNNMQLGSIKTIQSIYEINICDHCAHQIDCVMEQSNKAHIQLHINAEGYSNSKQTTFSYAAYKDSINEKDVAYILCDSFTPIRALWKELIKQYGAKVF